MADEVKRCETCGRPRCTAGFGACEHEGKECHGGIDCLAAGYEREKARADAAEAELEAATATFEDEQAAHMDTIAALAAARRECDGWAAENAALWARIKTLELARAALAVPADGDSK